MKKIILTGVFSIGFLISVNAGYVCGVAAAGPNNGHCRVLSSGNGEMCFTYGEGPSCGFTMTDS